jgi:CBS domain-containing protein
MTVGKHCTRRCATARPEESIREAAVRMDALDVGCLVVVDEKNRPRGVITDRDVALRVMRRRYDPDATQIDQMMDREVVSLRESTSLVQGLRRMRSEGLRRLPVVDDDGSLVGIFTADDALKVVAEELQAAAGIAEAQTSATARAHGEG